MVSGSTIDTALLSKAKFLSRTGTLVYSAYLTGWQWIVRFTHSGSVSTLVYPAYLTRLQWIVRFTHSGSVSILVYLRQAAKDELSFGDTISFVKLYRKWGNQLTSRQQYFVVSLHSCHFSTRANQSSWGAFRTQCHNCLEATDSSSHHSV